MAGRADCSSRSRPRTAPHAAAGFTVGLIAVSAGFLFGGTGRETAPVAPAVEQAATSAAVVLSFDPDATPEAAPPVSRAPVDFAAPGDLFTLRHATRVVVSSVGIDADVAPVGLVYRGGSLQYDVPMREAGQYVGTAAPGDPGNTVIGGHVALRGASGVFTTLPNVKAGDVVEVYRGAEIYRYSVVEIRIVAADATDVMSQTQDATLTLITCFPDDGYRERLVVVGKLL